MHRRFRSEGLRHSREGDAWQEYDGKTAHLPGVNPRHIGAQKDQPTVDLGRARSDGRRHDQNGGRINTGPAALFINCFNLAGGEL